MVDRARLADPERQFDYSHYLVVDGRLAAFLQRDVDLSVKRRTP